MEKEKTSFKEHHYSVSFNWKGDGKGQTLVDGLTALDVGAAPEFGGDGKSWNPEILILSALASCYTLTLAVLFDKARVADRILRVSVEGILTQSKTKQWSFTRFFIRPELEISSEDRSKIQILLEKAEKYCLISQSLKGVVSVEPVFKISQKG